MTAMRQFLDTAARKYPLPGAACADIDWNAMQFSLHGLRGAAGNLALPAIAELAGAMEELLRAGRREEACARLAPLRAQLAQARQALLEGETGDGHEAPVNAASPAPATLPAMLRLTAVLRRFELDDAGLDVVCAALDAEGQRAQAQSLRAAVDAFEFREAIRLLEELIAGRSPDTFHDQGPEGHRAAMP